MIPTEYVWMVLLSALVAANLPFLNNRWLALIPRRAPKLLWMRLAELVLLYFVVGAFSLTLEQSLGQIAPQDWEFYVTTASLFLTMAFPGFTYRYLYNKGKV